MKNHYTPFEQQGIPQESDLQDIFKLLTQLDKPKQNQDNPQLSNKSHLSKKRDFDPPISEESEPQPHSISNKLPNIIRIFHTPSKVIEQPIREEPPRVDNDNPPNLHSNMSAESQEQPESYQQTGNAANGEREVFIGKDASEKITEKQKAVAELQRQLHQYQQKYNEKQKVFQADKQRQKTVLANILKESNMQKIKYYEYLQHINRERRKIISEEILEKNEPLIKQLRQEESKYKPRKKVKNAQTMSLSDEEELKLSESMEKEKKYYFSVVVAKIEKEKEKYENIFLTQHSKKIAVITSERLNSLKKEPLISEMQPLCMIEGSNPKIEQILAVDLEKCHQVRIKCIKYNPTTPNDQRVKIHDKLLQTISSGKKLNSNHNIFTQKSTIFIPLSHIILKDDEILLLNECNHTSFPLSTFLNRLQLTPGQQQLHIVRYIVRVCIKGIQQINTQLKHDNIIILPQNLYFNEKWQLKMSNIALNQILFHHFQHIFHEDDYFYFPPEENTDKHSVSLWSLGILTYFLCFNGKPFAKYQPYHWKSREEFFMFNELQISHKSSAYDKCKEFITYCLNKKGSINFNEICCEPFFSQIK